MSPEYQAYMQSPAWQAKRQRVLVRDRYRCVQCGSRRALEVDHLHYHDLWSDALDDCQTLCRPCHVFVTRVDRLRQHGLSYQAARETVARQQAPASGAGCVWPLVVLAVLLIVIWALQRY